MNILSFDAVTPFASVALAVEGQLVHERGWHAGRGHAAQLPVAIRESMAAAGLEWRHLDLVTIGVGPGSYTGIRIAISLAKGIAAGGRACIRGWSTLEQLAYGCAAWSGPICATMALGPDRVGVAVFRGPWDQWARLTPDEAVPAGAGYRVADGTLVCGNGRQAVSGEALSFAPADLDLPHARNLLALSMLAPEAGSEPVEPNYLRLSTPEERLAAGL